jgi:hypothetical protein
MDGGRMSHPQIPPPARPGSSVVTWRLMPFLFVSHLIVNIGFAKSVLSKDLGISRPRSRRSGRRSGCSRPSLSTAASAFTARALSILLCSAKRLEREEASGRNPTPGGRWMSAMVQVGGQPPPKPR